MFSVVTEDYLGGSDKSAENRRSYNEIFVAPFLFAYKRIKFMSKMKVEYYWNNFQAIAY